MNIITDKKVKLIDWLCGEEIVFQYAQSRKLVTKNEYLKVKSIQNPIDKITELLDIILKKEDSICIAFIEMLKEDDVNESIPELRKWIKTVNTSALGHMTENSNTSQTGAVKITDNQGFLKKNRPKLIGGVKAVDRIVDDLDFADEMRAIVQAKMTDQEKMRKVLDYTTSRIAAQNLVEALYKHAADVMEELVTD